MSTLDSMLEWNKDLAASRSAAGTLMPSLPRALPNVKAIVIGCADMRVDPVHVLGVKPGEAVVMRNIGGRITPGLLEQLGLLGRIGEVAGAIPGGGGEFHLVVLQHTDCGITRLVGDPAMLTGYFLIQEAELTRKASPIPAQPLPSMLLCCGRFPHCRGSGLFPASSMTWRPDWLMLSYRQRGFVLRKQHLATSHQASARNTEMRIAETFCVFEPVPECAVSPDMDEPDRADRKEQHIGVASTITPAEARAERNDAEECEHEHRSTR